MPAANIACMSVRRTAKVRPSRTIARGAGFYLNPVWSPDSEKIAYVDNSASLYWMELGKGRVEKVAASPVFGPDESVMPRPAWSPDSRWIVYSLANHSWYHTVYAYDLKTRQSRPITDGLSDAADPVFDAGGKYLYFFASTDAGPVNQWFSQAAEDMRMRRSIYLVVLCAGVASPLVRESDEEKPMDATDEKAKSKDDKQQGAKPEKPPRVVIDFERIQQRIVALPEPPANYRDLQAGPAGQVFFLDGGPSSRELGHNAAGFVLKRYDIGKRKVETVLSGVGGYRLSARGKKALVFSPPESCRSSIRTPRSARQENTAARCHRSARRSTGGMAADVRRGVADQPGLFLRPGHARNRLGGDSQEYAVFLPDLTTRNDLCRVIRWMLSELSVGHSYLMPGPPAEQRQAIPGGLLGADYEVVDGRYRFRKVYGGLNWSRELRAADRARRGRQGRRVSAGSPRRRVETADRFVLTLREHRREEHRNHHRPQSGWQRQPHRNRRTAGK